MVVRRSVFLMVTLALLAAALAACAAPAPPTAAPAPPTPAAAEAEELAPAEPEPEPEPVEEEPAPPAEEEPAAPAAGGTAATFVILPDESEVRFVIGEILNNAPFTVVGVTSAVSGEIEADLSNPAGAQVRGLTVDLSTLATDNSFRNRALHQFILETGRADYQFATFEQTGLSGLPDAAAVGETYPLQISGNLTVHGVTRELTFDGTVTVVSETRLEGTASTGIVYQDFGVNIPRLPAQVASVEDAVRLEIDFAAEAR